MLAANKQRGDELGVLVDVDVVFVTIVLLPTFLRQRASQSFCAVWPGSCPVDGDSIGLDDGVDLASVALDRH